MTVQPIKRQKLTESVVNELLALIVRGEFQAGQRLPAERQLAEQMGVSRASVRDALARLDVLGHVEVRQGDGIYVREPSAKHLSAPFQGLLTRLPQQTRDLLEFRRMVEPEVAALAAQRSSDDDLAQLRACLEGQERGAQRGESLRQEDLTFHTLIARIAGNGVVVLVLDTLQELLQNLRQHDLKPRYPERTLHEHAAIVEAICRRSPEGARAAMAAHLDSVTDTARQTLSLPSGGTDHA